MAETSINLTEGSGKRTHGWDRTVSSVLVQQPFVLPGEYPYPSYIVPFTAISFATTGDHVIQLMAGSTNHVRIRRIHIWQAGVVTSASVVAFDCYRLSTAGTGGTAITPAKMDTADAAAGATAMTLPSSKGTESTLLFRDRLIVRASYAATGGADDDYVWQQQANAKPIIIPAGTSNGIAIKVVTGIAGTSTVDGTIEFVETAYL